ncbi:MAG: hypothetical protein COA47_10165 [Robiginitomaculum sp.]|nr:MAG: hypothetical protein COA47_10165 [Robiginitomaculum sp.]
MSSRDKARTLFKSKGLTYADLTRENVQELRYIINKKMMGSKLLDDSYRCRPRCQFQPDNAGGFWAGIRCKSRYFGDREAVSFNRDGFIGFGGWADDKNVVPIVDGFEQWVNEVMT